MFQWLDKHISLKIGTFWGVPLTLHWSWVMWMTYQFLADWTLACSIIVIFFFVVLHEYGHVVMAKWQGVGPSDVTIYPFGGAAAIPFKPDQCEKEFLVTIAGPAVNLFFFMVCTPAWVALSLVGAEFVSKFFLVVGAVNFGLMVFNLVPAFPLDGGRVFRSLLGLGIGFRAATHVAVRLGQSICVAFVILGVVYGHVMLIVISLLVMLMGSVEIARVESYCLYGVSVKPAYDLAHAGKYDEAASAAQTIEIVSLRTTVLRHIELVRQVGDPALLGPLLGAVGKPWPSDSEVRTEMAGLEVAAVRRLNGDLDRVLTALEAGKSLDDIRLVVDTISDDELRAECQRVLYTTPVSQVQSGSGRVEKQDEQKTT